MPAEIPESHQVNAPSVAVPVPPQETPQALLDKVSEGLANLESPPAPTDGAGTPAEPQPESYSDAASKGMVPAGGKDGDPEPTGTAAPPAGPTLPDAHRRSLKATGWTDEEISSGLTLGDGFLATADKIHTSRNAETQRWAELGRANRQVQTIAPAPVPAPEPVAPQQIAPQQIAPEPFQDPDGVGALQPVDPAMAQQLAEIQTIRGQLASELQAAQDLRAEIYGTQMDVFFGSDQMKTAGFGELYGPNFRASSDEQFGARNSVLEIANDILEGAKAGNHSVMFDEALQIAHDHVSKGFQESAIRNQLKADITQRSKSISLTPSKSKTTAETDKPTTAAELEAKVARGLQQVFSTA